jgi:hypothetical protein
MQIHLKVTVQSRTNTGNEANINTDPYYRTLPHIPLKKKLQKDWYLR